MPASTLIINRGNSESDYVSHGARKEQTAQAENRDSKGKQNDLVTLTRQN